jgi:two-component system, cell cycle sensor histidine kinase and response regulator CckA
MNPETGFALQTATWPALLVDATGRIRHVSEGAKTMFGTVIEHSATLASSIWSRENELTPEEFFAKLAKAPLPYAEVRLRTKDGNTGSFHAHICRAMIGPEPAWLMQLFKPEKNVPGVNGQPSGESTVLEAAIAHKQKLDCALQLTRTVALDFNNALTIILGHTSLLLSKLDAKHPFRTSLVEVEKSAEKAAEIAHDLAAFSIQEKDGKTHQSGNINDELRRAVELFKSSSPETIIWNVTLENRIYSATFDEAKLQQAFLKILENAVQALEGFGTVYVRSSNVDVEGGLKDAQVRLNPGHYVCVEIVDTGYGIPEEILPRIFEPFFSTKKDKGHRGLGLAWVYGIVTNHGGSVAVSSEINQGTSVRIYLPAQKKVVKDRPTSLTDLNGTQTILMIDDEDLLLTMGETVLTSYGYKVLTANNGKTAIDIFSQKSAEIDLVITDLVMPQMSGRELVEHLRKISPQVKVICASGFVRPPSLTEEENYLQKPFASHDLLRKVKEVLAN